MGRYVDLSGDHADGGVPVLKTLFGPDLPFAQSVTNDCFEPFVFLGQCAGINEFGPKQPARAFLGVFPV